MPSEGPTFLSMEKHISMASKSSVYTPGISAVVAFVFRNRAQPSLWKSDKPLSLKNVLHLSRKPNFQYLPNWGFRGGKILNYRRQ
jgi:hypothetical protein